MSEFYFLWIVLGKENLKTQNLGFVLQASRQFTICIWQQD